MSMRPQNNNTMVRGAVIVGVLLLLGAGLFWRLRSDDDSGSAGASPQPEQVTDDAGTSTSSDPAVTPAPATLAPPADPATTPVVVANAAKVKGVAGQAAQTLGTRGYAQVRATNANETLPTSIVYYRGDQYFTAAQTIAGLLNIPVEAVQPAPTPLPTLTDAVGDDVVVLVMIGKDIASA
jgi:hypothetical protein